MRGPPRVSVSVGRGAGARRVSSKGGGGGGGGIDEGGPSNNSTNFQRWRAFVAIVVVMLVPWALYLSYHPSFGGSSVSSLDAIGENLAKSNPAASLGQIDGHKQTLELLNEVVAIEKEAHVQRSMGGNSKSGLPSLFSTISTEYASTDKAAQETTTSASASAPHPVEKKTPGGGRQKVNKAEVERWTLEAVGNLSHILHSPNFVSRASEKYAVAAERLPVLGPVPTSGAVPLFNKKHTGGDAVFALACNYPKNFYERFVGSLRKSGFEGDIVLAVSPEKKMKPGVKQYIQKTNVIAYGFEVDCIGKDNCKLLDEFLGYPDPRPHRTFANIRYALYEYWLRHYSEKSYILILDFRDTFFQLNPFEKMGPIETRVPKYDLRLYAENHKVKTIGKCVYNSLWIGRCFGKPALAALKEEAVICSGSTLGSFQAIDFYIRTMLKSMDTVKCWLKGIESDQGYQNYLYYNGYFNTPLGNATLFHQGYDVVNTIGAMNGFRVPKHLKGPLDTFWKIRDKEGYILNYDGTRSACVHQWDRWYKELHKFIDTKTFSK